MGNGIMNANAFAGGFAQGIGLASDLHRMKLADEEIAMQRERQRAQDIREQRRLDMAIEDQAIQQARADREAELYEMGKVKMKIGDFADRIRAANRIDDEKKRQEMYDYLADSINEDQDLVKALNLNPELGTGTGRRIVGFQVLNPSEKNPDKFKFTPIVFNEAMRSVGPYTTDNTARWPKQAGVVFDVDALDRIAGKEQKEPKFYATEKGYVTDPTGLKPWSEPRAPQRDPWDSPVNTPMGIMSYREARAKGLREIGASGRGGYEGPGDFDARLAEFYKQYPKYKPGMVVSIDDGGSIQAAANQYGIRIKFRPTTDDEGNQAYFYELNEDMQGAREPEPAPGAGQQPAPAPGGAQTGTPQAEQHMKPDGSIYYKYKGQEYYDRESLRNAMMRDQPSSAANPAQAGVKTKKGRPVMSIPAGEEALYGAPGDSSNAKGVAPQRQAEKGNTASKRKITSLGQALRDPTTTDKEALRSHIRSKYGEDVLRQAEAEAARLIEDSKKPSLSWKSATGEKYIDMKFGR